MHLFSINGSEALFSRMTWTVKTSLLFSAGTSHSFIKRSYCSRHRPGQRGGDSNLQMTPAGFVLIVTLLSIYSFFSFFFFLFCLFCFCFNQYHTSIIVTPQSAEGCALSFKSPASHSNDNIPSRSKQIKGWKSNAIYLRQNTNMRMFP